MNYTSTVTMPDVPQRLGRHIKIAARCSDIPLGNVSLYGIGTVDGQLSRFLRHYADRLFKVKIDTFMLTKVEKEDLPSSNYRGLKK